MWKREINEKILIKIVFLQHDNSIVELLNLSAAKISKICKVDFWSALISPKTTHSYFIFSKSYLCVSFSALETTALVH